MWEFCISISNKDKKIAEYITAKMAVISSEMKTIITTLDDGDYFNLIMACEEYDKSRMQFLVKDCITEIICVFYKEQFLNERLKMIPTDEINQIALKKALINFDKETDKYIINKNLDIISKTINIKSFFDFKLKYLKEKWSELVRIANDNSTYLISSDTFIELLKFLVDNLEIAFEMINIVDENGIYKFYDNKLQEIELDNFDNISQESAMISNLINLCPKKITFYCDNQENNACALIKQIFYKRVTFHTCKEFEKNMI